MSGKSTLDNPSATQYSVIKNFYNPSATMLSLFLAINTHFIQINIQLGLFFYILSA